MFLRHVQRLCHFSKIQLSTANLIRIWFFSPLKLLKGCGLDSRIYGSNGGCSGLGLKILRVLILLQSVHQLRKESKVKGKQPHYSPGQALRVPGDWCSQISIQSVHEDGKVVSPTHRPPLPPRKYSWYSFLLEAESTPGPQCGRKDYVNEKFQWHNRKSNPWPSGL